ncbi:MAG: hypothetical protein ACK5IJ_06200 [Mangrovibacterium sp.]
MAQDKVHEIHIFHSYDDFYISFIAPHSCEHDLNYGPIIVNDSVCLEKIISLLGSNIRYIDPKVIDVRFRVEFLYSEKKETLCFYDDSLPMIYKGESFMYNNELCSLIIDIIEKTGFKKPKNPYVPPPPQYQGTCILSENYK